MSDSASSHARQPGEELIHSADELLAALGVDDADGLDRALEERLPEADPFVTVWEEHSWDEPDDPLDGVTHWLVVLVTGAWTGEISYVFPLPLTLADFDAAVAELGSIIAWREHVASVMSPFDPDDPEFPDATGELAILLGIDRDHLTAAIGDGWSPAESEGFDGMGSALLAILRRSGPGRALLLGVTDDYIGIGLDDDSTWPDWEVQPRLGDDKLLEQLGSTVARLRRKVGPRPARSRQA